MPSRPLLPLAAGLAALLAATPAVLGAAVAQADEAPAPQRQAELMHMVRQDCGSCHGMTMKGGLGRPLLPEDLAGKPLDALAELVLNGIPGTPMPPWRSLLSEDEARWIVTRLTQGLDP